MAASDVKIGKDRVDPAALTLAQLAQLLAAAGQRPITEAMVAVDVEAGAPTNADGTINLLHYAAWMAREVARGA